jgi:HEAT repeat protein
MTWSALGKPLNSREEAISAMGQLDKKNPMITETLVSYLHDSHFDLRIAAILALGARGDASAVAPLEEMRKHGEGTVVEEPYIDTALSLLKTHAAAQ